MSIREIIRTSLFKGKKPSSSRIMAYIMMAVIFLCGITSIGIEIGNAIISWKNGNPHTIPTEHIVIMGMWLAHQLTLLGIYKNAEKTKPSVAETISNLENTVNETLEEEPPSDSDNA